MEAYALFPQPFGESFNVLTIDVATGNTTKKAVTGPAAKYYGRYYGEASRVFPFDPKTGRFVFADIDLTNKGEQGRGRYGKKIWGGFGGGQIHARGLLEYEYAYIHVWIRVAVFPPLTPSPCPFTPCPPPPTPLQATSPTNHTLTVYTISPSTGASTETAVTSGDAACLAGGYPYGLQFDDAAGHLVVGLQTASAATFCGVDADKGHATLLSTVKRTSKESDPSFYAAFMTRVHASKVGVCAWVCGVVRG